MSSFSFNNVEFKYAFSAYWQKLFYHDLSSGLEFNTEDEVLYSLDESRYSMLTLLNNRTKFRDGKFEFLLEYPDRGASFYFRWKQSNNPIIEEEKQEMESAEGFESIYRPPNHSSFGGLVKTKETTTNNRLPFLNGVPSAYGDAGISYAVGIYAGGWYTAGDSTRYTNYPVGDKQGAEQCILWVKLPNKFSCQKSKTIVKSLVFTMFCLLNK